LTIENLKKSWIPALLILNFFFVYIYIYIAKKEKGWNFLAFSYLVVTSSTMISAELGD